MSSNRKTRILILGGGFGGIYAAMHLEKVLARSPEIEITLISEDNFFLFTPMLHEVAACDLDITHIVNPIRKLLKHVEFFAGKVEAIDLEKRAVTVSHGFDEHQHTLPYDHLVLALGSVTNFYGMADLEKRALTMKTLADAIQLRNRLIENLEEAASECTVAGKQSLLTFVVAGGGFAGVETMAAINDFARAVLRFYPNVREEQLQMVLVHPGDVILPELGLELGKYAQTKLRERKVDIRVNTKVTGFSDGIVTLSDGSQFATETLVWTAGSSPNPHLGRLPCHNDRGRITVNEFLEVPEWPGVWALGDCACIPDPHTGKPYPPTAQHAIRQGKVLAENLHATLEGTQKQPFVFKTIGLMASIGHRTGVASIFGIQFSGFLAWWLWRTVYLSKLPRLEKKVRVMLDWSLDLLFTKDIVKLQFLANRASDRDQPEEAPARL